MKICLFNPQTGSYPGEDFVDEALMKQDGYDTFWYNDERATGGKT